MQKRLMLAVILSMGVLLTFQILFPPPKPQLKTTKTTETTKTTVLGGATPSSSSSPSSPSSPSSLSSLAPRVTVATPLIRASLSTLGGRLLSWEILSYRDKDQKAIELLPPHPTVAALELDVAGESDRSVVYAASASSLTLGDGGASGVLEFRGKLKSGVIVVKSLSFRGSSYEAVVRVSLYNPTSQEMSGPVTLWWERGLSATEHADAFAHVMVSDTAEQIRLKKLSGKQTYDPFFKWAAFAQPFAMAALYPPPGVSARGFVATTETALKFGVMFPESPVAARSGQTMEWRVFGGPQTYKDLKAPGAMLEHGLDYGRFLGMNFSWLGLWLLMGLNTFFAWTHNYGVAIILVTIMMKLILFWPAHASFKSSRRMQALQPKIEELKTRYKNNPQQQQAETLRLYKEHKVNPLSGCLLILPQIPIFVALYSILNTAAELQGQPFFLWIHDLSKMDPYYVLPVLNGATMFLQQKMTPVADPQQAKIMLIMPVVFTFMFVSMPSGVVLYWVVQSLLSIIHQGWVMKQPVTL